MAKKEIQVDAFVPFVRPPYFRERCAFRTTGVSRTQQAHAAACDVNKIIARFERTGEMPKARFAPSYADVTLLQGDLTEREAFARSVVSRVHEGAAKLRKERAKTPAPGDVKPAAESGS